MADFPPDHELVTRSLAGDAYASLVSRYQSLICSLTVVGAVALTAVLGLAGAETNPKGISSALGTSNGESVAAGGVEFTTVEGEGAKEEEPEAVLSGPAVSPAEDPLETMRALYQEARRLNQESRRDEAAVLFERVLEMAFANDEPEYIFACYRALATIYRRQGDTLAAIDYYEKSLPHLREYGDRGNDVTRIEWRLLNNIMESHLSRGSLTMAQMAHWRAEESAVEYLTDRHPQFDAKDFYVPAPWHEHIVRDLYSYVQVLVNEADFRALRGDLHGSNTLLLETAKLLEERGRTHCDQRLLTRTYHLLSVGLDREGRAAERDAVVEKLLAIDTCACIARYQRIENLRRIERTARDGGNPEDLLRQVGDLVEAADNNAFDTIETQLTAKSHLAHRLAGAGRLSEAIELMDSLIARAEEVEIFRTLAHLRHERAILLLDHGLTNGVSNDLFAALDFYRQHGLILEEAGAYKEYIRYLMLTDRHDAALPVLTLALQRADRFGWETLKGELLGFLDESREVVANSLPEKGEPEPRSTIAFDAAGFIDLQPIQMFSRAESGEFLRGRFTLTNTGIADVEGVLEIDGPVVSDQSGLANGVWAVAVGAGGAPDSRAFILAPGERRIVYLETEGDGTTWNDISLRWSSEGEAVQEAWWLYSASEGPETVTVVQASLAMENPFYAVPFYHETYLRTGEAGAVDFRVRSSHPAYIEAVDVDTGRLLAIDSSGNGRFDGVGDAVFRDTERNGFPDIFFETGNEVPAIELHVYPRLSEGTVPEEIIVELDLRPPGSDWETKARNRLVPGS